MTTTDVHSIGWLSSPHLGWRKHPEETLGSLINSSHYMMLNVKPPPILHLRNKFQHAAWEHLAIDFQICYSTSHMVPEANVSRELRDSNYLSNFWTHKPYTSEPLPWSNIWHIWIHNQLFNFASNIYALSSKKEVCSLTNSNNTWCSM